MPDRMKINDDITIGAQPSAVELKTMADDGIKTVINLRVDGEKDQPLSPGDEADVVKEAGMAYEHVPVSMKDAGPELVDKFREKLAAASKPVFVHCQAGKRAGALTMMDHAVKQGWSGQDTLDKAKEMGFECDSEQLEGFVRQYVDSHNK